jgi:hypothetical protein
MSLTVRTPDNPCPSCGSELNAATGPAGLPPDPGDISVCYDCGEILTFNDDLTSRKLTAREMIDLQRGLEWPLVERMALKVRARIAAGTG